MLPFTVEQLHEAVGGELVLAAGVPDGRLQESLKRIVTDSRQVQPGDVFWALPGTLRDGAEFIEDAIDRGAAGVVTHRMPEGPRLSWTIRVQDSLAALWRLASWQRNAFTGRVVGVTGSVGKTTTRL